jgi:hypothetical protein
MDDISEICFPKHLSNRDIEDILAEEDAKLDNWMDQPKSQSFNDQSSST